MLGARALWRETGQQLRMLRMECLVRKIKTSNWMSFINNRHIPAVHRTTKPVLFQTLSSVENINQEHDFTVNSKEGFKLYEHHIQTSFIQKAMLAAGSAFMGLYDPTRQDMIAALGETTGYPALKWMHSRMLNDPVGSEILSVTEKLAKCNSLTLMSSRIHQDFDVPIMIFFLFQKISADTRTAVKFVDDKELAYVMQRYRDVHDFVHTLSGIPTVSIAGEIAVKWFEFTQTQLPMCALGAMFGPLNINVTVKERRDLLMHYIPWAVSAGLQANFFLNVFYEKRFEDPIDSIREELNLIQAPKV
ncbi:ubiquinone biosynthesis protein COQ4 homolog, mitochondrial-like isoform X2 [Actinia tenebrosa]|uniref:Ubiquinone biosynthesis protein COQ4 homolog, mitochondrial n=1 Tax=Actinia tenebrosa TaxID=6105 RepID=A0A6P8H8X2_ACTTE|nr:ubiquinone biosynthesis protein COQ4 homolog, mitochondrial-like isoform X2 [Actinia tenebrosa]